MKQGPIKIVTLTLLAAALACGVTACQGLMGEEEVDVIETPTGAAIVETYRITAIVTAVDPAKRTVTLASTDGGKKTYKAAKQTELSKVQVGDSVTVEVTEELAVALRKDGAPPSEGVAATVALAARGKSEAVLMADAAEVTARITAIDAKKRKVTLQFADGSTKTLKVGKKIDLSKVEVGNDVVVQIAEALAIEVQKT